jgi:hypothetical protein
MISDSNRVSLCCVGLVLALAVRAVADDGPALSPRPPRNLPFTLDIAAPAWDISEGDGAEQAGANPLFDAGSWIFQTYGSASINDNDGVLYLSHTGAGYFVVDNLSLNLELVAGGIDSKDRREDDGYALGLDLLVRWHFLRDADDWSLFLEGGAGLFRTENPFPAGGTHQNFTPQGGLGGMARLFDNVYLMGGIRWHHISNARRRGINRNPGFDAPMFYVGVMIPF